METFLLSLTDADSRLRPTQLQVVEELVDDRYPFDCDVIEIDENTWAIHGPVPFDGEQILAEFRTKEDAEAALEILAAAEAQMNA